MATGSRTETLVAALAQARAGDPAALGRLLDQHRLYLAVLARGQLARVLQAKVDASDVVQETFLEAHRDFGQFRGDTAGELVAWLRQILTRNLANQARHYRDTRRRDVRREQELGAAPGSADGPGDGPAAPVSTPSQAAGRREAIDLLADALVRLPDDYRQVIVLRNLEELSFADVAGRMGKTVDSVKKLWARGLVSLRKELPEVS
jgi:RNA polymerase sigma-70 factor (ECF subfamily)